MDQHNRIEYCCNWKRGTIHNQYAGMYCMYGYCVKIEDEIYDPSAPKCSDSCCAFSKCCTEMD